MMTLEEAIKHCKDVALSCTNKECALEHFQLLKWLQEYSNMLAKQGEQKSTDKAEPKFHEGDWITNGDYTWKVIEVKPLDYILQSQDGNIVDDTISYVDGKFHSFTIENAKDGDVLTDGITIIFIFKDLLSDGSVMSYCDYDTNSGESDAFCPLSMNLVCSKITLATKEQRDALMKAMTDAGYTFDFEKKELKKIEQKPAWNEEDEKMIESLIESLTHISANTRTDSTSPNYTFYKEIDWLKSLKDHVLPKIN